MLAKQTGLSKNQVRQEDRDLTFAVGLCFDLNGSVVLD